VTWAARTENPDGKTTLEELADAAHSASLSMALALRLGEHQAHPEPLQISATVTLDVVDEVLTRVSSHISVTAEVPGLDGPSFQEIFNDAAQLFPIPRLFAGAQIELNATLRPS